jgi:hypothetical protein
MRYGIAFVLVIFCAAIVRAAPPSDQSINEMMGLMQLEALLNQALKQMDEGMAKAMDQGLQQSLKGKELSPSQKTAVENFRNKFAATVKEELSFAKVKDIYMQAYRETFSQEEVNAIIVFYKSPAGKAITEKSPAAMQKANSLMQARIGPMTQKLQTMQEEFVKELARTK